MATHAKSRPPYWTIYNRVKPFFSGDDSALVDQVKKEGIEIAFWQRQANDMLKRPSYYIIIYQQIAYNVF